MHEITKEMVNFVTVPPAYAGEKGLEICPGRKAVTEFAIGDEWSPADPLEGAITVNIGDMLMQWSDDRLKSTFHRVRMPRPGALGTLQKFSLSSSHAPYARSCSARAATCAVYTVVHTPQVFSIAKTGPNNFVACSWPSTAQPTGCSHIGTRQTSPMRSVVQR